MTDLEQLAKIMQDTLDCELGEGSFSDGRDWYGCFEHESDATDNGHCTFAETIAQAIIDAGWTAPVSTGPEEL